MALIVAPFLSLIAYFGVDFALQEKPHKAIAKGAYKLKETSKCRWGSGICYLENEDVVLTLKGRYEAKSPLVIQLHSTHALKGAKLATDDNPPKAMKLAKDYWVVTFDIAPKKHLRLAVQIKDTWFYAQTSKAFLMSRSNDLPSLTQSQ